MIVYASSITPSTTVYYDNSNSTLESTTVQDALDELYVKVNKGRDSSYIKEGTLYYQLSSNAVLDNIPSEYVIFTNGIDFSKISSDYNGEGVYEIASTKDNKYPIYYYRGAVTDNNVLFANFCWKIVRTTETGGVKLIYNGSPSSGQCNNTGTSSQLSSTSYFNSSYSYNAYVGYMYGTPGSSSYVAEHANTNNSTIKTAIDNWYKSNMTSYTDYLEDTVWCSDRRIYRGNGTGASTTKTYYGAYTRLYSNKGPSLTCFNSNDSFTVSSSNGNGALTYPVALLTADEVTYAGGVYDTSNSTYYLYTGQIWWLLSPYYFYSGTGYARVWSVNSDATIGSNYVAYSYGVRPAISLKPGTTYTSGDGSTSSPYVVE